MPLDQAIEQASEALNEALSLMVAYEADDGFDARNVLLAENAAEGLRAIAQDWLGSIATCQTVSYEATAELAEREVFLIEDEADLEDFAPLYELADQAAELPVLSAQQVNERLALYAVVAGSENRVAFFKKTDPRIGYTPGTRLLAILGQRLRELDEPAFAFHASFDFVLADDWALVSNQTAFERLFRDAGLIDQHIDGWVTGIGQHLPWAEGAVDDLREVAHRDSRVWRRLREINRRGHLVEVTIDQVREYAEQMDLPVDHLIEGDELTFDADDRFSILHLLNEDLFRGALTQERFEAQRKTGA